MRSEQINDEITNQNELRLKKNENKNELYEVCLTELGVKKVVP
jgi:hypothetical protein